jgi:putative transposase
MPYWRLYYHIVWGTRLREPLITPEIEQTLYPMLSAKMAEKRAWVFAVGGIADHVHMVAAIPPSVSIAEFVKFVKGATSYSVSAVFDVPFHWQRGYGVFSLNRGNLKTVIEYVKRQKQHHRESTTIADLERVELEDCGPKMISSAT